MPSKKSRIQAHIIDVVILFLLAMLLNPVIINQEKLTKTTQEVLKTSQEYLEKKIESDEYQKITNDQTYKLTKYSWPTAVSGMVLYIVYFSIIPLFTGYVTIGKRISKLRISSKIGEKVHFWQLLLRSSILYGIIANALILLLLFTTNQANYLKYSSYINYAQYFLFIICFVGIMSKTGEGLHENLSKTVVVAEESSMDTKASEWKKLNKEEQGKVNKLKRKHTSPKKGSKK